MRDADPEAFDLAARSQPLDFGKLLNDTEGRRKLLWTYRPYLAYARAEGFWADSAEMVFAQVGSPDAPDPTPNLLRGSGKVLASTEPSAGTPLLSPTVLGELNYEFEGRQLQVGVGDYLDLGGDRGLSVEEYSFDSHFRRDLAAFANVVHGRVVADDKFVWLQYWLFFYYNDKAWVLGGHECDWEVVQFGFDRPTGRRALATFSQHNHPEGRAWDDAHVKSGPDGNGAIVYVALQSHANYFEPGDRKIAANPLPFDLSRLGIDWLEEVVPGDLPLVRPHVVSIDDPPSWAKWPGRWGEDHAAVRLGKLRDAGNSPEAPCLKSAWNDPYAFHHGESLPTKRGDRRRGRRVSALPKPTVARATRVDRSLAVAIEQPSLTARRRGSRTPDPNRVSVVVRRRGALEPAFLQTSEPGTAATSIELPPKFRDDELEVQVALADPLGRVSLSDPVLVP